MNVKPACHAFAVCCFVLFLLLSPSLNSQSANDDDARLRVLVERFFAAYHRKDLNDFMGLWSPKSPQYASRKKAMQELFAAGNYTFANVTIPTVKVEGEVASLRANLRAVFDMTITNQSPQKSRKERLVRDLVFVREDGAWKIWSYGSPLRELEDLASKLIEKKTEEERTSLLRERGDLVTSDLVMALGQQGNLSYLRGDYQQARGIYQLAGSVAEQIGDKLGIANSRSSVANVLLEQGEYEQAREYFEQGLSQYEAWGDKSRVASAWNNLGIVYERQGNYAKAAECYQKSLTAQEAKEDVSALANMGNILTRQGNYPQALNYYQRCLKHYEDEKDDAEITRRLRSARMAVVLNNIGVVYGLQKHYLQALAHFQQGLELSRTSGDMPGVATALNNVGLIRVLQNEYAQALEAYRQGLPLSQLLGDKMLTAQTLNNVGMAYEAQGDHAQALDFAQQAIAVAEQIGHLETLWKARTLKGQAHRSLNQTTEARQAFQAAISTIEKIRAQVAGGEQEILRFFEDKVDPYRAMIDLLIEQQNPAEAFAYAERAKARSLLNLLRNGRVNITQAMTKEEKDEERKLKSELLALNAQVLRERDDARRIYLKARLEKVRRDYDTFLQSTVYAVHPELQAQRGESEPTTVVQAAQWLRAQKMRDVVVLEYVVWDKQTWLFAFNETGKVKVYPVNLTIEPLRKQVEALQAAIRLKEEGKQGSLPPIETALRQLDSVLAPAAPLLSKAKQVCIIPDDALWEVPFAALKTPDGKYLIERCAVFYAPSVTALKAMAEKDKQQRARPSVQLLAMAPFATSGNRNAQSTRQVTARGTFGTLPASLDEVKTISSMFSAKPYLREAATETRAKAGLDKARILHFATHGLFEPSQGMYSGLVLANEKGEDGYWEAWEIAQSQSKANLAVLSACETARGQLSRGEGIIGLSWAFFVAGCPSTVVSQWKVRDASTAELMKSFYQNLKKGMNKAESLRQAQLSLLRSNTTWRHPFYWSPFILVGNWQ